MERGTFERINPREEFGRNIEAHLKFIRHAERGAGWANEVPLTEEGVRKSEDLGESLDKKDRIEGEYSDTVRARNTTESVVFHSPTENKLKAKERDELAFHCTDEFLDRSGEYIQKVVKEKYEPDEYDKLSKEQKKEIESTIGEDYYFSFAKERPDEKTYSPEETAATVARRLEIAIRKVNNLHSGTKMDSVFTSHDYVVAAFLKEVLIRNKDGKKIKGFNSLEEIGGPMGFLEGFEITVKTDEMGNKLIGLLFRGEKCEIDMERFNELLEVAARLEKEESKNAKAKSEKGLNEVLEEELGKKIGSEG